jgi:hypothetical protein
MMRFILLSVAFGGGGEGDRSGDDGIDSTSESESPTQTPSSNISRRGLGSGLEDSVRKNRGWD